MAKNIEKIAAGLGAKIVGQVPDTGGGAFGAARLAKIVETMQGRAAKLIARETMPHKALTQRTCHQPQSNRTSVPYDTYAQSGRGWRFRLSVWWYEISPDLSPLPGSNGPVRPVFFAFRRECEIETATLRLVTRLLG